MLKKIARTSGLMMVGTLFFASTVFAQSTGRPGGDSGGGFQNPLKFDSLTGLLVAIGNQLYLIAIPLVTIMILWGAFLMLTAAGNPDRFNQGKRAIVYAIIGFIVVLIANGLPALIRDLTG
jgi:hypothetical protein